MKKVRKILAGIIYGLVYLVSLLPMPIHYFFADILYFFNRTFFKYRQSVVIQNLSRSFPTKGYGDIRSLYYQFTSFLFSFFAENIKLFSASKKFLSKRISFQNLDILSRYHEQGKSVILVLGHYGNWELLNVLPEFVSQPVYAIYKQQRSPIFNQLNIWQRSRFDVKLLESKKSAREILKNRANPSIYIFIADQSPSRPPEETYTFLHQKTKAFAGAEKMSKLVGAAVVYMEIKPVKRGYSCISFTDISNSEHVTQEYLHQLEQSINTTPQYWLWSHRRWKYNFQ